MAYQGIPKVSGTGGVKSGAYTRVTSTGSTSYGAGGEVTQEIIKEPGVGKKIITYTYTTEQPTQQYTQEERALISKVEQERQMSLTPESREKIVQTFRQEQQKPIYKPTTPINTLQQSIAPSLQPKPIFTTTTPISAPSKSKFLDVSQTGKQAKDLFTGTFFPSIGQRKEEAEFETYYKQHSKAMYVPYLSDEVRQKEANKLYSQFKAEKETKAKKGAVGLAAMYGYGSEKLKQATELTGKMPIAPSPIGLGAVGLFVKPPSQKEFFTTAYPQSVKAADIISEYREKRLIARKEKELGMSLTPEERAKVIKEGAGQFQGLRIGESAFRITGEVQKYVAEKPLNIPLLAAAGIPGGAAFETIAGTSKIGKAIVFTGTAGVAGLSIASGVVEYQRVPTKQEKYGAVVPAALELGAFGFGAMRGTKLALTKEAGAARFLDRLAAEDIWIKSKQRYDFLKTEAPIKSEILYSDAGVKDLIRGTKETTTLKIDVPVPKYSVGKNVGVSAAEVLNLDFGKTQYGSVKLGKYSLQSLGIGEEAAYMVTKGGKLMKEFKSKTPAPELKFTEPTTIFKETLPFSTQEYYLKKTEKLKTQKGVAAVELEGIEPKGAAATKMRETIQIRTKQPAFELEVTPDTVKLDIIETMYKPTYEMVKPEPIIVKNLPQMKSIKSPAISEVLQKVRLRQEGITGYVEKAPRQRDYYKISNIKQLPVSKMFKDLGEVGITKSISKGTKIKPTKGVGITSGGFSEKALQRFRGKLGDVLDVLGYAQEEGIPIQTKLRREIKYVQVSKPVFTVPTFKVTPIPKSSFLAKTRLLPSLKITQDYPQFSKPKIETLFEKITTIPKTISKTTQEITPKTVTRMLFKHQYKPITETKYEVITKQVIKPKTITKIEQIIKPETITSQETITTQIFKPILTPRLTRPFITPRPAPSPPIRIGFPFFTGVPLSFGKGFGARRIKPKRGYRYAPSLAGIVSGKKIKKAPKGEEIFTGFEIRLPI